MRNVDLHGLTSEEAMIEVVKHLYDLRRNKVDSVLFITGNGTGTLKSALETFLDKNNIKYQTTNNGGAYQVDAWSFTDSMNSPHDKELEEDLLDEDDLDDIFTGYKF
ncbi:Smr/MutS family protein [Mycoplasmopsis verecunda]|uniref:Smr domain-containing protein n=1 Tax=Mycoplasmopsis verecunda TaxID=171291 RepID=A0A1T4KNG1_9BACT|nr:Smr/MutS family protein [Mycoplasmopsis verecunda]WPB54310.1 Smr/MutS family protein [Mycoplasmopsis verecunda]SJZ43923.1 Smr domain-containing protein [Mycoplasmopsis verecunda]